MMALRRSTGSRVDETIARSVNFELTIADLARRSERRAWWVASSAIGMSLILGGGYFYMLPLKEKVPYLVMADAYTGTSTVARLTEDASHRRITSSEAINRSNVAHFVMARESYDLAMLKLGDWTTVQTMSAPGVKAEYTKLYSNDPGSLFKSYGRNTAIRVKLLSIVLIGSAPGVTPKGATVRFQRNLYDKSSGVIRPLDNKLATIEFAYKPDLEMDDRDRIENPLGFWVTSYRVDTDYASPAPVEIPAVAVIPVSPQQSDEAALPAAADRAAQMPDGDLSRQPTRPAAGQRALSTSMPGAAPVRAAAQGVVQP